MNTYSINTSIIVTAQNAEDAVWCATDAIQKAEGILGIAADACEMVAQNYAVKAKIPKTAPRVIGNGSARRRGRGIIATSLTDNERTRYKSITDAACKVSGNVSNIHKAARGLLRSAYGHTWKYADETICVG